MRNPGRIAFSFSFTFFVLLLSHLAASFSFAEERIHRFESEIVVNADGSAHVVETINVRAEGNAIRRGIFRDVLTRPGQRVTFDSATRDGKPDGFRTEQKSDRVRLYVGRPDRMLAAGEYTYQLTYAVTNVVGTFSDHD